MSARGVPAFRPERAGDDLAADLEGAPSRPASRRCVAAGVSMSARGVAFRPSGLAMTSPHLERARFQLAAARNLRDVRGVHLRARVLAKDATAAQDVELVARACVLIYMAERKGGRMLAAGATCATVGSRQAGQWRHRAALSDDAFAAELERARRRVAAPQPRDAAHMVTTEWTRNASGMVRYRCGVDAEAVAAGADPQALARALINEAV